MFDSFNIYLNPRIYVDEYVLRQYINEHKITKYGKDLN